MIFVLDNSVSMRWLLPPQKDEDFAYAIKVLDSLTKAQAVTPLLWSWEAANVIAKAESKALVNEAKHKPGDSLPFWSVYR